MFRIRSFFVVVVLGCWCFLLQSTEAGRLLLDRSLLVERLSVSSEENATTTISVLIGYKNDRGKQVIHQHTHSKPKPKTYLQQRVPVVAASISSVEQLDALHNDPDVDFIEEDTIVKLLGEIIPPGIAAVDPFQLPALPSDTVSACDDPSSFRVGLVDSGLDATHPDLPCLDNSNTCVGSQFGLQDGLVWSLPDDSHGTMVAGIVGASHNNSMGVLGVLDGRKVCFVVARVFQSMTAQASMSDVLDGLEWAVTEGKAKVINLSLGGPDSSTAAQMVYDDIINQGVVLVAAAGNDGTNAYMYPASYANVVSVAAVDTSMDFAPASFSNYNDMVDLAAPGVQIFSTTLQGDPQPFLSTGDNGSGQAFGGSIWQGAAAIAGQSGVLIDCGTGEDSVCPTNGGSSHVCLMQRSNDMFSQQIENCQLSGGVGAIIYNNVAGPLAVTLNGMTDITIPAVGITMSDGATLLSDFIGQTITISTDDRYEYADGTSFASPHVAGAAAAIWQLCPACTNDQVRSCLQDTARDLGAPGKDNSTGNGLVQVEAAYLCLLNDQQCCHDVAPTASSPTSSPVPPPTTSTSCADAQTQYQNCLNTVMVDTAQSCVDCFNSITTSLSTSDCTTINDNYCPGLTQCGCNACLDEIAFYLTCFIQSVNADSSCTLSCDNTPTTAALPATPSVAPGAGSPAASSPSGSTPATSPVSSPVSATNCDAKLSAARDCVSSQLSSDAASTCTQCVNSALPDSSATCDQVSSQMCTAINTCACGTCQSQISDYYSCSFSESLSCQLQCSASDVNSTSAPSAASVIAPTTPTPVIAPTFAPSSLVATTTAPVTSTPSVMKVTTPVPSTSQTASPSVASSTQSLAPTGQCSGESESYLTCFNETLTDTAQQECKACVMAAVQKSYNSSCELFQTAVCDSIQFCPCGECGSQLESYLSCFYGTDSCPITCNYNPTSCQSERQAYSSCLYSSLSEQESTSCQGCVMSAKETVVAQSIAPAACSAIQEHACASFGDCSNCGTCSNAAQQFLACRLSDQSQGACAIDCGSTDTTSSGTPTTGPAASSPSAATPTDIGNSHADQEHHNIGTSAAGTALTGRHLICLFWSMFAWTIFHRLS